MNVNYNGYAVYHSETGEVLKLLYVAKEKPHSNAYSENTVIEVAAGEEIPAER